MRCTPRFASFIWALAVALIAVTGCWNAVAVEESRATSEQRGTVFCEACNVEGRETLHQDREDRIATRYCDACQAEVRAEGHVHGLDTICPRCGLVVRMAANPDVQTNRVDASHRHDDRTGEALTELCDVCLIEREVMRPNRLPTHIHFRTMWCAQCGQEARAVFAAGDRSVQGGRARPTPWTSVELHASHVHNATVYCPICNTEVARSGHYHHQTQYCAECREETGIPWPDPQGQTLEALHRALHRCVVADQSIQEPTRRALATLVWSGNPPHSHVHRQTHFCVICGYDVGREMGDPVRLQGSNPIPVTHDPDPANQHREVYRAFTQRMTDVSGRLERATRDAQTRLQEMIASGTPVEAGEQ